MPVEENAPAKINLGLKITGKRSDGYHNILSIFQTVKLFDTLNLTSSLESRLTCTHPEVPQEHDNLVIKADGVFRKHLGIKSNVHYFLNKRIPVGAGLAGGSSDAAATLRGLRTFYGVDISDTVLQKYAAELGSDVPFLLRGGTAVVSGRGECIEFVRWPLNFTYVIVYPGFGISTAWAYGNIGKFVDDCGAYKAVTEKLKAGKFETDEFFGSIRNDFEPVVFAKYPVLKKIKTNFMERGAQAALLTGSGSSVLGVFEYGEDADYCAKLFKNDFSGVFAVKAYT